MAPPLLSAYLFKPMDPVELWKEIEGNPEKEKNTVRNPTDVQVVSLLADFSWEIVSRRKAEEEIRALNQELEQRVIERTAELESTSVELQNSQSALMNIVEDLNEKTVELERANSKLKEVDRLKSMFIASMSHELRTPLNSILGFSHLMRYERNLNSDQIKNLEIINRSGEHLLNLINNVLDISKIEAGRVELEESPLDLYQFSHELASLMSARAQEKGLDFTLEQSPDLPRHVTVDGGKLRQILINLVGNAIKYTAQGGDR